MEEQFCKVTMERWITLNLSFSCIALVLEYTISVPFFLDQIELIGSNLKIAEPLYSSFKEKTVKLLKQCEEGVKRSRDDRDYSVYTGSGGKYKEF